RHETLTQFHHECERVISHTARTKPHLHLRQDRWDLRHVEHRKRVTTYLSAEAISVLEARTNSQQFPVMLVEQMEIELLLAEHAGNVLKHLVTSEQRGREVNRLVVIIEKACNQTETLTFLADVWHQIALDFLLEPCGQDGFLGCLDDQCETAIGLHPNWQQPV